MKAKVIAGAALASLAVLLCPVLGLAQIKVIDSFPAPLDETLGGTGAATVADAQKNLGLIKSINPQQYGAVGDGVADDTAAVQAWIDDLKTGDYVGQCNGIFRLDAGVNGYSTIPYRMNGAGGLATGQLDGGCMFYVNFNGWSAAAIDLSHPSSPTNGNRMPAAVWGNFTIKYNPALTAPPIAFRHRYSQNLHLHDVKILQYTVNRGTCVSLTSAWNLRSSRNVVLGCGGNASANLVAGGTTFSITSGTTTITASAATFSATDVGHDIIVQGPPDEAFRIASFTDSTHVEVVRAASHTHTNELAAISGVTGSITAAGPTLTISADKLSSSDVGRNVYVLGAGVTTGTGVNALRSTISAVSGTTVTLADNAVTTAAAGSIVVIGPAVEIYPDPVDTGNSNDVALDWLQIEQFSGTGIVLQNVNHLRLHEYKMEANVDAATFGQNNNVAQYHGIVLRSDYAATQGMISNAAANTVGHLLFEAINNTAAIGNLSAAQNTGTPAVGLYKNAADSIFTVGLIHSLQVHSSWIPFMLANDGTSTRGFVHTEGIGATSTTPGLPKVPALNGVAVGDATATAGNVMIGDGDSWESQPISGDATLSAGGALTLNTVGVAKGGTGQTSLTSNAFLTGAGTGAINQVAITGLVKGNGASAPAAYAGDGCTNQFVRSLDANGDATCASVADTDLTGTVEKAHGGTGATTGRGAASNLSVVYALCQSAVQVSHTGDTNETTFATCTVPANAMGANGRLLIFATYTYTNSANTKTFRVRFGGIGGTSYSTLPPTTTATARIIAEIANRNATNSQAGFPGGASLLGTTAALTTSAVDTTASVDIVITGQLTNTGETVALESYLVQLISTAGN